MNELLNCLAAMPKTHVVITILQDGTIHRHETRNEASARNYAAHMCFRFGKSALVAVEKIA